jgi:hypothetical protein
VCVVWRDFIVWYAMRWFSVHWHDELRFSFLLCGNGLKALFLRRLVSLS